MNRNGSMIISGKRSACPSSPSKIDITPIIIPLMIARTTGRLFSLLKMRCIMPEIILKMIQTVPAITSCLLFLSLVFLYYIARRILPVVRLFRREFTHLNNTSTFSICFFLLCTYSPVAVIYFL